MCIKKIAETLGVPLRTTKPQLQRAALGGSEMEQRSVGRPCGAEAGFCFLSLHFRLTPLELPVVRVVLALTL